MTERLRVAPALLDAEGALTLTGDAAQPLRVARLAVNEALVLFDGAGRERDAVIESYNRERVVLALRGDARDGVGPDGARVTWLQGYPKGDKFDTIVRQATELGVAEVVPVYTARSVPRERDNKGAARVERWARIAEEAARQCGRADVPAVRAPRSLDEALRGAAHAALRLVAWEEATAGLAAAVRDAPDGPCAVLAGPEGGIEADEVARCVAEGFRAVSLGPRVLRAETVAPALLAALSVLRGDLRMR